MKLKNIAIYALVTGGLSLPVMTSGVTLSHAAEGSVTSTGQLITFKPDAPVAAWVATQVSAAKSKRPYCSVEAKFEKSGATIVIARNKRGLNSMAIDFGHNLFEKGKTYNIRIGTDIGLERGFPAKALSTSLLMAQIGHDKPFMRAISYNGDFTFFVPQTVRAKYTLKGADDALTRLERCLSTLEDYMPPLADETYLREARAKVVKKRGSGRTTTLVDENIPSRTASAKIAQRTAPENVPVPPRKANMMNIKVTKVEAPVVYEDTNPVSDDDSVAQPDMVEIARQEISDKIDELAVTTTSDVKPGEAEEHVTVSEKTMLASKPKPKKPEPEAVKTADTSETQKSETQTIAAAEEPAATDAVAVKKTEDGGTVVADVSVPLNDEVVSAEATPVVVADAAAKPPAQDTLMTPMPGAEPVEVADAAQAESEPVFIEVKKQPEQIVWSADRTEVKDPAAKNIIALEKRGKTAVADKPAVKTASTGASLLPTPDLDLDIPSEGAYFPQQTAAVPEAEIEKAITVKVETPAAAVDDSTQMASLQAVNGPFNAAEYARLKKLAQEKRSQENRAKEMHAKAEAQTVQQPEPINLMAADTEAEIADIATAAGEDLETAGLTPEPTMKATAEPVSLTFSSAGALSQDEYLALKKDIAGPVTAAPVNAVAAVKQSTLSDAVNQLIPAEFQITVGNGVDMTQKVSWQDGENWQNVITEALGSVGVEATINGNVVMLMTMAQ